MIDRCKEEGEIKLRTKTRSREEERKKKRGKSMVQAVCAAGEPDRGKRKSRVDGGTIKREKTYLHEENRGADRGATRIPEKEAW
jgi:hypothetical protein